jgi:hypothetical protein
MIHPPVCTHLYGFARTVNQWAIGYILYTLGFLGAPFLGAARVSFFARSNLVEAAASSTRTRAASR